MKPAVGDPTFLPVICVLHCQPVLKKEHKCKCHRKTSLCAGVYFPLDCMDMNLFLQFLLKINCRQFLGNLSDRNKHTDICFFF